ncbi:MAG: hypothetical protein ABJL44_08735 [Algibacter sp.]
MFNFYNRLIIKLDSLDIFYKEVKQYYSDVDDNISVNLKNKLYYNIAYKIHNEYKIRRLEYPKSLKRYSKLKTKDLDHPYNKWFIIDFVKEENLNNYRSICSKLLKINETELLKIEKNREEFYNMF